MKKTEIFWEALHLNLGEYIRNEFGIWSGNHDLAKSCILAVEREIVHEDEASSIIIRELWKRLRETHRGDCEMKPGSYRYKPSDT